MPGSGHFSAIQLPHSKLSEDEINNPYCVVRDFFSYAHLPEIRNMLWQFFRAAITGNYPKELDRQERNDIVYLYELLERLVEAVHLINEQRKRLSA